MAYKVASSQPLAVPATMRAAVLFGPGDLRVVRKPVPRSGPGEVLVRVAMCGTCGTDLKIQTHPFPNQPPFGMYTACLNYGNLAKGHRTSGLTTDGGFAEYVVHHVNALFRIPDEVSWEDAVLVTTAGTGMYGLDAIGGYVAGDTVVVIGPGPVG